MRVLRLDHVNIAGAPSLIARCRDFYVDLLGLTEGDRPAFRSRGFWLYAGTAPVVHLSERDVHDAVQPEGPFAHYAFFCSGLGETIERLKEGSIPFTIDDGSAGGQTQLFLHDPAGIPLELNFGRERVTIASDTSRGS